MDTTTFGISYLEHEHPGSVLFSEYVISGMIIWLRLNLQEYSFPYIHKPQSHITTDLFESLYSFRGYI
jgi:hypothetical protein